MCSLKVPQSVVRMEERRPVSRTAAMPNAGVDRATRWVIALFFVTLFIPGSFYMGVRMTPYRLFLIAMAIPMLLRFRNDPTLRITAVDALMFLACAWRSLAVFANHGTSQVAFAGASFMELFFGYLLGRAFVRRAEDYRWFFRCFLAFLFVALPLALLETATRTRVVRDIASGFLLQPDLDLSAQIRFGLMRAQLSFDHAILFGTFCALGVANVFYINHGRFPRNVLHAGFVGFVGFLAISSSTMLNIAMQVALMAYEWAFRPVRVKWVVLGAVAALFLSSFRLLFGMSFMEYVAFNWTLNVSGALARLDQIQYGMLEIRRYPVFGIGLNEFTRPFWRGDVFDNFWLAMAVRFGTPTALFFAAAFLLHAARTAVARNLTEDERKLRLGYLIAFAALVITLGTHSIWGSGMVYVMLYVGVGGWLYDTPRAGQPHRPLPARRS